MACLQPGSGFKGCLGNPIPAAHLPGVLRLLIENPYKIEWSDSSGVFSLVLLPPLLSCAPPRAPDSGPVIFMTPKPGASRFGRRKMLGLGAGELGVSFPPINLSSPNGVLLLACLHLLDLVLTS